MQKSVGVGDYFENDDNGLWSWYLTSIRNGDFEELTRNQLKHSLLKRFLRTHLDPAFEVRQDAKILIVSIAEDVRRDIKLLEYFLHDHFHLDNMDIKKLTSSRIYNHENHYMVMDEKHNFKNLDFLHFASSNIQAVHHSTGGELATTGVTDQDQENPPLSEPIGIGEDTASEGESMVFNFAHHDRQLNYQTHAGGFDEETLIREQMKTKQQQGYSTSNDEITSIDSYDPESNSARIVESFKGEPLTLTVTRTEDFSSSEGYNSMNTSAASTNTSLPSLEDCSMMSILPSISVADSFGHFRLVLQSVLFLNPTNNEIFTAIRQSNNKPTIADVNDDWLLYDSQFSMHNLEILTLQDLSELNKECPKILFYSLVEIFDTSYLEKTKAEWNTIPSTRSSSLTRASTKSSISREPEGFSPINLTSDGFGSGNMAKINTSYSTVGHGSIVTTNSAGEVIRQSLDSYGTGGPTRWHKSTIGTYKGSDGIMKRIRSTPLPNALKTISVGDKHHKRWRDKFKLCRSNRLSRRPPEDRGCIIC